MITAETIIQEASALPLAEQYRVALQLLQRAQTLFVEPSARSSAPSVALAESASSDRSALLREAIGSMRGRLSTVDEFLQEKHAERERENARDVARLRREAA